VEQKGESLIEFFKVAVFLLPLKMGIACWWEFDRPLEE
jgi:hypothetical protein